MIDTTPTIELHSAYDWQFFEGQLPAPDMPPFMTAERGLTYLGGLKAEGHKYIFMKCKNGKVKISWINYEKQWVITEIVKSGGLW